jgi:purine catabolism regulator
MALRVRDLLALDVMRPVRPLTGDGLEREVRWVHTWPEVLPWLHGGELLLTTAYSWPTEAVEQRRIVRELERTGVAALLFQAGRFFPSTPQAVVAEAAAVGLAVLEAGEEVSFIDLTETVNREIIRAQFATIIRSDRIHRALTEAALEAVSVADIAGRLSTLIERPVVVLDRRGRPLTPPPSWWPSGQEAGGGLTRPALWPGEAWLEEAPGARLPASPPEGGAELAVAGRRTAFFPIRAGQDPAGWLVLAADEALSDLEVRAGEHAAVVLGLHLLRQQAVAEAEARVRNTFVEAALQGRLADEGALRERALLLGFDPQATYTVALAVLLDGGQARQRALVSTEEFRRRARVGQALHVALEAAQLPVFLAYALNQVILLLPAAGGGDLLRRRATGLWEHVRVLEPHLEVALVLGRPRPGLEGIPLSLREAEATLAAVRGPGVWWHEDLLVLRILTSAGDRDALAALRASTVGALERRSPSLVETARALVRCGFRQRETARHLGVHWNTLRHRVARIEQVLGGSLDDPEVRLRLHLGFVVDGMVDRA